MKEFEIRDNSAKYADSIKPNTPDSMIDEVLWYEISKAYSAGAEYMRKAIYDARKKEFLLNVGWLEGYPNRYVRNFDYIDFYGYSLEEAYEMETCPPIENPKAIKYAYDEDGNIIMPDQMKR